MFVRAIPKVGNLAEDGHERFLFMRSNDAGNPLYHLRVTRLRGLVDVFPLD